MEDLRISPNRTAKLPASSGSYHHRLDETLKSHFHACGQIDGLRNGPAGKFLRSLLLPVPLASGVHDVSLGDTHRDPKPNPQCRHTLPVAVLHPIPVAHGNFQKLAEEMKY